MVDKVNSKSSAKGPYGRKKYPNVVMDAMECPSIEMLEEQEVRLKLGSDQSTPKTKLSSPPDSDRSIKEIDNDMKELHLKESLKAGPITKFNGVNVIKMVGDKTRLFFGENPKAIIVTFLAVNLPSIVFNILIAGVSSLKFSQ